MEDEGLGAKFWFKLIGIVILGGIAAMILFLLVDAAWYRWGGIGAIIFFSAAGAAVGLDLRQAAREGVRAAAGRGS